MNQRRITVLAPTRTGPRHTATLASTRYQTRSNGLRPRRQQHDGPAPQTTNERQGRSGYSRSRQSSARQTPLHQRGFFEVLRAPLCSLGERPAMSVVSGPVWSGEVAVQQRAINRGTESYHLPPTRQAKTRTNAGDSIVSARQPDAGGRTARPRVSTQTAGLGTRRASPSTSRKHLFPTPAGPTSLTAVRVAYPSHRAKPASSLDYVGQSPCKSRRYVSVSGA